MSKFEYAVPILAAATKAPVFVAMWTEGRAIPLAVGIRPDVMAATPEGARKSVKRAMWALTNSRVYRRRLAEGGPRYRLDMTPDGEITPEQIASAKARWSRHPMASAG